MKRILYLIICLFLFVGCNNTSKSSKVAVKVDGSVITLNTESSKKQTVKISVGQLASFSTSLSNGEEFNLMDSLKNKRSMHYELAYELAQNKGSMKANIAVANKLDTVIQCQFKHSDIWGNKGELLSGKFAKVVNTFDSEQIDAELRRWVYKNKKINIGEALFNDMRLYLRELSSGAMTEFVVNGAIPVMNDSQLNGTTYKVSSDMIADYYVLFACDKDEDIDAFLEDMVAHNMPDCKKSLSSPLHCYKQLDVSGLQCVFLVGINNDWSSQVIPLGAVITDNSAPRYDLKHWDSSQSNLSFPKRGFSISATDTHQTDGCWYVEFGSFQGWSPFDIPYTLTWKNDVSKIIIHNGTRSQKTTVIDLEDKKSPFHITIPTVLPNTGDNYIKIEAVDKAGNRSTTDLNIATKRIKDE